LDNPELFKKQIRAILRAGVNGNIKIMLPFITTVDEVRQTKRLIRECEDELIAERKAFKEAPLGIMIETPAAAMISDSLAKEVSFFSIGTNDLTGYMMAVDRTNPKLGELYDVFQPAVLRAIRLTLKNAKHAGIKAGICGEAATDPELIPKLIKWGVSEFSVNPNSVLKIRKIISECE
jgi:phosphoenolpyruvate-protein kinase (PTS system EI component)